MAVEKMSISMDAELAEKIRQAADDDGLSVSAWIATQVDREIRGRGIDRWLDEYEAEHGAFTEEELRQARMRMGHLPPDTSS
jgi:post-segregation antitoxin (ccd killing protein)